MTQKNQIFHLIYAVECLEYTFQFSNMIKHKIAFIMQRDKRNSTTQKLNKFVRNALRYCLLKLLYHSNSWIWPSWRFMRKRFRSINNILHAFLNIFLSSHIIFLFFQYSLNYVFFCSNIQTLFVRAKVIQFFKMKRNVVELKTETRSIFLTMIISIFSTIIRIRFMILLLFTMIFFKTWFFMSTIAFCQKTIVAAALLISKINFYYHRQVCDFKSYMSMLTSLK